MNTLIKYTYVYDLNFTFLKYRLGFPQSLIIFVWHDIIYNYKLFILINIVSFCLKYYLYKCLQNQVFKVHIFKLTIFILDSCWSGEAYYLGTRVPQVVFQFLMSLLNEGRGIMSVISCLPALSFRKQ